MTFISYAQNFEDVMLWRALKNIKNGFYIDIGAQDPLIDSVSLAFYEQGWRGVHVEPTKQYSNKLRVARQDEIVEQVIVGNSKSNTKFFEFPDTGLSTADPVIAKKHLDAGFLNSETDVPVVSIDDIFAKYGNREIHWLKVDVEGFEKNVLESWNASACRPWILVIESTKPLTQDESYEDWESIVLAKGYEFAYFDGLNRFYVHKNHQEILHSFNVPPNIFDGFELSGLASQPFCRLINEKYNQADNNARQAEIRVERANAIAEQNEIKAMQAVMRTEEVLEELHETKLLLEKISLQAKQAETLKISILTQLNAVHSSVSWRITAPMRKMVSIIGAASRYMRAAINASIRNCIEIFHRPLVRLMLVVLRDEERSARINKWLLIRYPALHGQLRALACKADIVPMHSVEQVMVNNPDLLASLSPRARELYERLDGVFRESH
ncbi:FkbM family methyltransferase [Comamonas sediminis]|uniref:FkbM family methyltransferase n=1 Tax=Comamonas sediminis TaxID=1783360 RepID=UPI003D2DC871